ncbi:MAG: M20 family metallopeptidase [Atribacterota bacterium]
MNGHFDTVPVGTGWTVPPLGGQGLENRLYGRGACDMKGAVAAMMYAAKMVSHFSPSLYGKLKLVFVVDEEQDNLGIRKWIEGWNREQEPVHFAVVGEPTGLNISLGHRGVAAFRVTVRGKSCHAGIAERGQNAITLASEIIRMIQEKNATFGEYEDPDIGKPAFSVGKIQGGTSPNVVPELCSFEIDVRTVPGLPLNKMESILRELIELVLSTQKRPASFNIEQSIPHLLPVKIPRDLPEIDILSRSISDIPGEMPIFAPFPASCEATFLDGVDIPTVIFGPGRIEEAHGANEFVSITQIVAASRIYSLLALRFLGGE